VIKYIFQRSGNTATFDMVMTLKKLN